MSFLMTPHWTAHNLNITYFPGVASTLGKLLILCVSFTWTIKTAPCLSSASRFNSENPKKFSIGCPARSIRCKICEHLCSLYHYHSVEVNCGDVGSPYIILCDKEIRCSVTHLCHVGLRVCSFTSSLSLYAMIIS